MYKSNAKGGKRLDFAALDILVLWAAFVMAYYFRHGSASLFVMEQYRASFLMLALSSLLVAVLRDGYAGVLTRGVWEELKMVVIHVTLTVGMLVMVLFLMKVSDQLSRMVMVSAYFLSLAGCFAVRCLWKQYVVFVMRKHSLDRSVLLVTSSDIAEKTVRRLEKNGIDFRISGIALVDVDAAGRTICGYPVVCGLKDATDYLISNVVDEVFCCATDGSMIPRDLIANCQEMGIITHVNIIPALAAGQSAFVESFGGYDVVTTSMKVASSGELFLKRCLDIVGGLVGCAITGLLCLVIVPIIKVKDPGPAFYTSTRIGKHGREFKMYKFRSMYRNADARKAELMDQNEMGGNGLMFKMKDDPRVLPGIGEFIRKTSIDEFPQFLNVLKGDMSLCGTRPPIPSEVSLYELQHYKRLAVKPGITGLWQASGRSDITDFEEVVRLDSTYIQEWTLAMDVRILMQTVLSVVKKEGAA